MSEVRKYTCSITGLEVLELKEFINVNLGDNYIFNITKIGDSIIYIQNRGDMSNYNVPRFYDLLDKFIIEANVKVPYIEIRSYKHLTGRTNAEAVKLQKDYLLKNENKTAGLIFTYTPMWLGIIAKAGFSRYRTKTEFRIVKGYKEAIDEALKILKYQVKKVNTNINDFKLETIFEDDLKLENTIISNYIYYTRLSGSITKDSILKSMDSTNLYFDKLSLRTRDYIRIMDYKSIKYIPFSAINAYRMTQKLLLKKYDYYHCTYFILSANIWVKSFLAILGIITHRKYVFLNSINDVILFINKKRDTHKSRYIKISEDDLYELNFICGSLLWDEDDDIKPEENLSSDSPLYEIQSTLDIVRNDIIELRKHDKAHLNDLISILDSTQAGIVLINIQQESITYFNRIASELIGVKSSELFTFSFSKYKSYFNEEKDVLTKNNKLNKKYMVINRVDGKKIPIYKWSNEIIFQKKNYVIETFIDISEIKKSKEDLAKALEAAEMANIAKSEFLANMSHEIRTPMNGILGAVDMIRDLPLTEKQQQYVNIIQTSGEALLVIINDILDYSKLEAGKMEIDTVEFDLKYLLDNFIIGIDILAKQKGLDFVFSIQEDIPLKFIGDPGRIRQVLFNLVGNAIKFTKNGSVFLSVELIEDYDSFTDILFRIKDTGIGIANNKLPLLFSKFTQVDGSITRDFGGTGLGLAISSELVELMGSKLEVVSELGAGSTFYFKLRLKKDLDIYELAKEIKNHHTILYIYDTKSELIESILDHHKYKYETLNIKSLENYTKTPDLIIIDLNVPKIKNLQEALNLKKRELFTKSKLLFITNSGNRGDRISFKEAGYSGYLTKPITDQLLYISISRIFSENNFITRYYLEELGVNGGDILLVEDNRTNRIVAKNLLKKLGYQVTEAVNGKDAIDILQKKSFDLILMDIQMPVLDGLEATRIIRESYSVPIIAMTANVSKENKDKCLSVGMNDFIPKPIRPIVVTRILEKYIYK